MFLRRFLPRVPSPVLVRVLPQTASGGTDISNVKGGAEDLQGGALLKQPDRE